MTDATESCEFWKGRVVSIRGVGGSINVCSNQSVNTHFGKGVDLKIEQVPQYGEGFVAFRVHGTQKYLTIAMYGDTMRQAIAESLATNAPSLLPEHIPMIVDWAVEQATGTDNFEGSGFNYSPMTVQNGPPNILQVFQLEAVLGRPGECVGVKSKFGTYWRSQHWSKTVSQSDHLLGDEQWWIQETEP